MLRRFCSDRLKWTGSVRALVRQCDGQDLVEYSLLVAIVALGAVAALSGFQSTINNVWTLVASNLSGGS
jgi:Flp pilus assembly pilin Flp